MKYWLAKGPFPGGFLLVWITSFLFGCLWYSVCMENSKSGRSSFIFIGFVLALLVGVLVLVLSSPAFVDAFTIHSQFDDSEHVDGPCSSSEAWNSTDHGFVADVSGYELNTVDFSITGAPSYGGAMRAYVYQCDTLAQETSGACGDHHASCTLWQQSDSSSIGNGVSDVRTLTFGAPLGSYDSSKYYSLSVANISDHLYFDGATTTGTANLYAVVDADWAVQTPSTSYGVIGSMLPPGGMVSQPMPVGVQYNSQSGSLYTRVGTRVVSLASGETVFSSLTAAVQGSWQSYYATTTLSLDDGLYRFDAWLDNVSPLVIPVSSSTTFVVGSGWGSYYDPTYQAPGSWQGWNTTGWYNWTGSTSTPSFSFNPLDSGSATSSDSVTQATMDAALAVTKQWFDLPYLFQTKFPFSWVVDIYDIFSPMASTTLDETGADLGSVSIEVDLLHSSTTLVLFSTTTISEFYSDSTRENARNIMAWFAWSAFMMAVFYRLTREQVV